MKERLTLLEWLKIQPEASMKMLTGYNDVYIFMGNLKLFGLAAFDVLPSDKQFYIIQQYVDIYK